MRCTHVILFALQLVVLTVAQSSTDRLTAWNLVLQKSQTEVGARATQFLVIEKLCYEELEDAQTKMDNSKVRAALKQAEASRLSQQIVEGSDEQVRNDKLLVAIQSRKMRIINQRDADGASYNTNSGQITSIKDAVSNALAEMVGFGELGQTVIDILNELENACLDAEAEIKAKDDDSELAYTELHAELMHQIKTATAERKQNLNDVARWNVELVAAKAAFGIAESEALDSAEVYDAVDKACEAKYSDYETQNAEAKKLQNSIIEIRNVWQTASITNLAPVASVINAKQAALQTQWDARCSSTDHPYSTYQADQDQAAELITGLSGDAAGTPGLYGTKGTLEAKQNLLGYCTDCGSGGTPASAAIESTENAQAELDEKKALYEKDQRDYAAELLNCSSQSAQLYVAMNQQIADIDTTERSGLTTTDTNNLDERRTLLNGILTTLQGANAGLHGDASECSTLKTSLDLAHIAYEAAAEDLASKKAIRDAQKENWDDLEAQIVSVQRQIDHTENARDAAKLSNDLTSVCDSTSTGAAWATLPVP